MTDAELVQQARRGERDAIEALYRRHAPRVCAIVRRLAGDDALAEDWAQEAWVQAIRALPGFRGEAQFGTWLYRIAVNRALMGRRSLQRSRPRELPLSEELSAPPPAEGVELRGRLEWALRQLPEGMRQVLVLHDVEGYTHEEIGRLLGVAAGTCKSQLFKARARMRRLLQPSTAVTEEEICNTSN